MTPPPNLRTAAAFRTVSWAALAIPVSVGGTVLCGWIIGVPDLTRIVAGGVPMKPLPALAFLLAGVSIGLCQSGTMFRWRGPFARTCAGAVLLLGLLTLAEGGLGWNLSSGVPLFRKGEAALGAAAAGNTEPWTPLNFVLLGLALLFRSGGSHRSQVASQALIFVVVFTSLLMLVESGFSMAPPNASWFAFSLSLPSAFLFLVVAAGVVSGQPQHGVLALVLSPGDGGRLARRLLPVALGGPVVCAAVLEGLLRHAWLRPGDGTAIFAVLAVLFSVLLILQSARALDRWEHERQQTALAVRDAAEQRRLALEAAGLGAWDYHLDTGQVFWDEQCRNMFGFAAGLQMDYTAAIAHIHDEDRPGTDAAVQAAIAGAGGGAYHREFRVFWPDGSVHWVASHGRVYFDENGDRQRATRFIGVNQDITERKRAEERITAFAELGRRLSGATTPLEAARVIAAVMDEMLGWDHCSLALHSAAEGSVRLVLAVDTIAGQRVEFLADTAEVEPSPLVRKTIVEGPQLILRGPNPSFSADLRPVGDATRPSASLMFVPIRAGANVVGVLSLQSYAPNAYDREALAMLEALAGHCGAALERIRVEETLRASQARLQLQFDHMPIACITAGPDMRIVSWNPAAERTFGYTAAEALGQHLFLLVPEAAQPPLTVLWQRLLAGDNAVPSVNENRTKDGRTILCDWINAALRGPDGAVLGVLCMAQDITERKRAEETVRRERLLLRTVVDHLPHSVYVKDRDGRKTLVNRREVQMMGLRTEAEALGKTDFEVYPADLAAKFTADDQQVLQGGREIRDREEINIAADGRQSWLLTSKLPLKDERDQIIGLVGIGHDITERKQAEEALAHERNLLRTLINNLPDFIYVKDAQNRYLLSNIANARLLGLAAPEQALGKTDRDFFPPELAAEYWATERKVLETGQPLIEIEERLLGEPGRQRWQATTQVPLRDPQGKVVGLVGVGRDITERKRAEEEIQKLNAELEVRVIQRTAALEASNKELEAFSYSISHDLRTPLRAIDGYARILIEDHQGRLDAEGQRLVDVICGEARRMGQLIDDLLAFSRLGRRELRTSAVDMTALVRSVFQELTALAPKRAVEWELAPLPPAWGDPALLRQVWVNLLSNALKFTQTRDRAVIRAGSRLEAGQMTYYIQDNGAGFDMRFTAKLFGVFQRLHRNDEFPGTGVGLALVQRIIHRHGGRVWAEGKVNEGATFYFSLPNQPSQA